MKLRRHLTSIMALISVLIFAVGTVNVSAQEYPSKEDDEMYMIEEFGNFGHEVENFTLSTEYILKDILYYWNDDENFEHFPTSSKAINVTVSAINVPEGTEVIVEHVYATYTVDAEEQDSEEYCLASRNCHGVDIVDDGFSTNMILNCYGEPECHLYTNCMEFTYDLLIRHEGDEYFHKVIKTDEFLVPVASLQ